MPIPYIVSSDVNTALRSADKAALASNVVDDQTIAPATATINNLTVTTSAEFDSGLHSSTDAVIDGTAEVGNLTVAAAGATAWGNSATFSYGNSTASGNHRTALGLGTAAVLSPSAAVNTLLGSANKAAIAVNSVNGEAIAPSSVASTGAVSGTTGTFSGLLSLTDSVAEQKLLLYTSSGVRYGFGLGVAELRIFTGVAGHTSIGQISGDGTSWTEYMRVADGGNVGIGTTSPAGSLHINASAPFFKIEASTGTNYVQQDMTNSGGSLRLGVENSAGGGLVAGAAAYAAVLGHTGAYPLHLVTNNTIKATITSSGNVGIGTNSPVTKLDVLGDVTFTQGFPGFAGTLTTQSTNSQLWPAFTRNLRGKASLTDFEIIAASPSDYSAMMYSNAGITFYSALGTFTAGQTVTPVARMFISTSGNVGIGTASPGEKLEVAGNIKVSAAENALSGVSIINTGSGTSSRSGVALGEVIGSTSGLLAYINATANFGAGAELFAANSVNLSSNAGATGGITINPYDGPIVFGTGGFATANERMRITTTGNVGIGTASPGEKLEVSGNIKASGFIRTEAQTVGSLVAAGTAGNGARSYVTNSNLPFVAANIGTAVAAGGTDHCPVVVVNGTWVIG